jgi:hypothetical protein
MTRPALSTARLRLFAAMPVIAAAWISFDSIRHLAEAVGFGSVLSWFFPLTIDACIAYGTDLWIRRERSPAMRQARALALTSMAISMAANAVDHYMTSRLWEAAVLGALPPAVLAVMLLVLQQHSHGVAESRVSVRELRREEDHAEAVREVADSIALGDMGFRSGGGAPTPEMLAVLMEHQDDFWSRIAIGKSDACWPWETRRKKSGYGRYQFHRRTFTAHRVAWAMAYGRWPEPTVLVRHLCDNPPCCNPAHLAEGTDYENAQDRYRSPDQIASDLADGKPFAVPNLPEVQRRSAVRKRSVAASKPTGPRVQTARLSTDREIVAWIADQPDRVTKAVLMSRWSVGSGRALRLMKEAQNG